MPNEPCIALYMPAFAMGDARMVSAMAPLLRNGGFRPFVVVEKDEGVHRESFAKDTLIVTTSAASGALRGPWRLIHDFLCLRHILFEHKPSWLLTSHTAGGAAMGILAAKSCRAGIRTAVFLPGPPRAGRGLGRLQRLLYRGLGLVLRRADYLFADAHYISGAWAPWVGGRKPVFFGRVPLPAPTSKATEEQDDKKGALTAVVIGRASPQKRLDVCLRAVKLVRVAGVPLQLRIVSAGADGNELAALIAKEELQSSVHFVGFTDEVETHLRAADVYLQSSDWEPLGMAILEALSLGKRVVSTDCVGPSEILRDGIGWLAPRGDVARIAQAILAALRAPAIDPRRQERAREYSVTTGMPALLSILRADS